MKKEEIFLGIEKILDDWDPIGVLQDVKPITYENGAVGEYSEYVRPLINTYLLNNSTYDFLIKLQSDLWDNPNEEMEEEISLVSKKILSFLFKFSLNDIKKCRE